MSDVLSTGAKHISDKIFTDIITILIVLYLTCKRVRERAGNDGWIFSALRILNEGEVGGTFQKDVPAYEKGYEHV